MIDRRLQAFLATLALLAVLRAGTSQAQCPDGLCPVDRIPQSPTPSPQPLGSQAAHCRILVGDGSTGSGTLIDRNASAGLVLTCAHLFDDATEGIVVAFPDGGRFAARLVDRDRAHDLAALVILRPEIEPIPVDDDQIAAPAVLTACGYGFDGRFRPVAGPITGRVIPAGATFPSVKLSGAVRPGDSGGAVLNARGRLVGVVWGQRDGETYFNCCQPLRRFLDRVLHRRQEQQPDRHVVEVPTPSPQSPVSDTPAWQQELDGKLAGRFGTLDERLRALHGKLEKIGAGRTGLFQGLSFGKLLVGTLGLSGPVAAAVVVAGALIGRRARTKFNRDAQVGFATAAERVQSNPRPIAVDTPPLPQRTVPETHFVPYERDAFARAHQWASAQVVRKYPGAVDVLSSLDSLIKQQLNSV